MCLLLNVPAGRALSYSSRCPPSAWHSVSCLGSEDEKYFHLRICGPFPSVGRTGTSTMAAASPLTNFHSTPSINSSLSPYQKTSAPTSCPGLYQCYKYPGCISAALEPGARELGKREHQARRGQRERRGRNCPIPSLTPPGAG